MSSYAIVPMSDLQELLADSGPSRTSTLSTLFNLGDAAHTMQQIILQNLNIRDLHALRSTGVVLSQLLG